METAKGVNLFIVDDNKLVVADLKHYLQNRFGSSVNISTFYDGDSCLAHVNSDTHIVILDYFLEGKNGLEVLKSIKAINPKTEVIMLSSNENIALVIESFRQGAKDYVVKGHGAVKKIAKLVTFIITEPIRIIARELGVSKFLAAFLLTFVTMAVIVIWVLNTMK
jgi:DNA-binding NarL/FixJ family response regulator